VIFLNALLLLHQRGLFFCVFSKQDITDITLNPGEIYRGNPHRMIWAPFRARRKAPENGHFDQPGGVPPSPENL
jgi:hypothetical protein